MAIGAAARAGEERLAFLRIPCNDIADFVGESIRHIGRAGMEELGDVGDLFAGKSWKRGHAAIRPPIAYHGPDGISLCIVQYQTGTHQIWPTLAVRVVAMAKAAVRDKDFLAAFYRGLVLLLTVTKKRPYVGTLAFALLLFGIFDLAWC